MEFPAPVDQARTFQVGLAARGTDGLAFPLFSIELPAYPRELSRPAPRPETVPGSARLAVTRSFASNVEGLRSDLRGVDLLEDGRMRWSFTFLNGSGSDQSVGFDYAGIYLQDELGNRYPVLSSDTGGRPGQVYREVVQRAVRADHWFEFSAPYNGARSFTVLLVSHDRKSLRFLPFDVKVPYYPPRYSVPASTPARTRDKPPSHLPAEPA